jgi:alanyl-tRNA synthetase
MTEQRTRAKEAHKAAGGRDDAPLELYRELLEEVGTTDFTGRQEYETSGVTVKALVGGHDRLAQADVGTTVAVVLDRTPFYAESGGQVGDRGELVSSDAHFDVVDTIKLAGTFHGHVGKLSGGMLRVGDAISASVDGVRRQAIVLNHSATHLLHAALRKLLGDHVTQKGSLVAPDRLRFDFSHFQPVSHEDLAQIEWMVNAEIRRNVEAEVRQMGMQEALDFGAMALFGEKYGENVRVLRMGDFSTELCGGTHVHRTGDIGVFKLLGESRRACAASKP